MFNFNKTVFYPYLSQISLINVRKMKISRNVVSNSYKHENSKSIRSTRDRKAFRAIRFGFTYYFSSLVGCLTRPRSESCESMRILLRTIIVVVSAERVNRGTIGRERERERERERRRKRKESVLI